MIEFHRVSLADKALIRARLDEAKRRGCEYSFGNIVTYGAKMPLFVADVCGCLVTKCDLGEEDAYCFPVGGGERKAAVQALIAAIDGGERKAYLYGMDAADKTLLEACFPGRFEIHLNRDSFDYVYACEDLTSLAGKKYQAKRNHISFFKRNTLWSYERITKETIPECLSMSERWLAENTNEFQADLENELEIIKCAFENYEALDYVGGLLRADGEVIAYTMGERLTDDVFCVHIEKAFADIRGAYPLINQQFVEHELQGYRYINREDDVGADNLRRAKESYHPAFFVEKYETRVR